MHIIDTLKKRGMLAQITFEEDLYKLFDSEQVTFYIGYDATADSLTVGHFATMMLMAQLQRAGHRPIALVGGGTTMVGDPSDRDSMRPMLTIDEINHNADCIHAQLARLIDFGDGKAILANNAEWLLGLNYVEFLREIGAHFSVNRMLTADCYKQRLEKGLTFLEFNYMLMQGYDFLELNRRYGAKLQCGGDDQWSNILAGADLIRRKERKEAFAMTIPLLTTSAGIKMGKTAAGALWLSPQRTSPYEFFQYFRNTADADVVNYFKVLTFRSLEEIDEIAKLDGSEINRAKEMLATDITTAVHGEEAAKEALEASRALFGGGADMSSVPSTTIDEKTLDENSRVVDLLTLVGLAKSKGDARRLIEGGGIYTNGDQVSDASASVNKAMFDGDGLMLRKGKKSYHLIKLG